MRVICHLFLNFTYSNASRFKEECRSEERNRKGKMLSVIGNAVTAGKIRKIWTDIKFPRFFPSKKKTRYSRRTWISKGRRVSRWCFDLRIKRKRANSHIPHNCFVGESNESLWLLLEGAPLLGGQFIIKSTLINYQCPRIPVGVVAIYWPILPEI